VVIRAAREGVDQARVATSAPNVINMGRTLEMEFPRCIRPPTQSS
jgi:hypothetical protein